MSSNQNKAMILAIISGCLLLISGISGAALWETIADFITLYLPTNTYIETVLVIIILIASLGGLSVLLGGLLIGTNKIRTGKILIALGAGMGLIGLLVSIFIGIIQQSLTIGSFFSLGTIGIILSIVARKLIT